MEGTIGEIRMFAATFAPKSWAYCQNQTLPINSNQALFSILGTTYGGNGVQTFNLPDMQGRVALGLGQGPGLGNASLGEKAGSQSVTLNVTNLPQHTHAITGSVIQQANTDGTLSADANNRYLGPVNIFTNANGDLVSMKPFVSTLQVAPNGSNLPLQVITPYIGMNYIICLYGIFPSRD